MAARASTLAQERDRVGAATLTENAPLLASLA
jgi:hypothetical protein